LQKLCGIAAGKAENIITYLQSNYFTTIADLSQVSGIGNGKTLQDIIAVDTQCRIKQHPNEHVDEAQLMITEVFFDDDDERIELFNKGSGAFSGEITLSGAVFQ
jgi:hypothetical protein